MYLYALLENMYREIFSEGGGREGVNLGKGHTCTLRSGHILTVLVVGTASAPC